MRQLTMDGSVMEFEKKEGLDPYRRMIASFDSFDKGFAALKNNETYGAKLAQFRSTLSELYNGKDQFTIVMVHLKEIHYHSLQNSWNTLPTDLAEIYHVRLFGQVGKEL